jgi:hypothetical protein
MGVKERLEKYGLRVICLACGPPTRHFPGHGRLRNQTCRYCRVPGFMVSWAWVCKYPWKAEQKRKQATDVERALR